MRINNIAAYILILTFLSGCTSMSTSTCSLTEEMPGIETGSRSNPADDHFVFIPENTEFTV